MAKRNSVLRQVYSNSITHWSIFYIGRAKFKVTLPSFTICKAAILYNMPLSIVFKDRCDMQVEILGADATKEQSCFDDAVAELDYDNKDVCGRLIRLGLKPEADGRYTRLLFKGRKKIGRVKCFERMLEKLIEWNLILPDSERDAKQNTPLHYAVRVLDCNFDSLSSSEPEDFISNKEYLANNLCTTLLDHGANPLAKNAKGKTALDVWLKHREILVGDTDDVEELLLNSMADARECLRLKMMDYFAQTDMGKRLDAEIIEIINKKTLFLEAPRGKRFIRGQKLDAMLAAEGITPEGRLHKCVDGYYYHRCIEGGIEIDMAVFRFRYYIATTGAVEYEDIVKQLRRDHRLLSYADIHEKARDVIGGRLRKRGVCF